MRRSRSRKGSWWWKWERETMGREAGVTCNMQAAICVETMWEPRAPDNQRLIPVRPHARCGYSCVAKAAGSAPDLPSDSSALCHGRNMGCHVQTHMPVSPTAVRRRRLCATSKPAPTVFFLPGVGSGNRSTDGHNALDHFTPRKRPVNMPPGPSGPLPRPL